jgi:hypothetical protein
MTNLAQDPEHEDKRKELHDRLMAILVEQNDPRVVETPVRFEHPPYAGPVPEDWKIENAKGVESLGTSR